MLTPLTLAGLAMVIAEYMGLALWTRALERYRLRVWRLEVTNGERL